MKIFVNLITSSRFIYTLFLPYLQSRISNSAFLINLIILFLTDTIDGFLARKYRVQTYFGSVLDTIADKTLSIVLLIILAENIGCLLPVLIGELLIAFINASALIAGEKAKTLKIGKVKMWVLATSIVFGYFYYFNLISYKVEFIICIITVILQVVTFFIYAHYLYLVRDDLRNKKKIHSPQDLRYVLFDTDYYLNSFRSDNKNA